MVNKPNVFGLEVAKLRDYRKVIMKSDCLEVVECFMNKSGDCNSITLVQKITAVKRYCQMVKF